MEALDYLGALPGRRSRAMVRHMRPHGDPVVRAYRGLTLVAVGEAPVTVAARCFRTDDREVRALTLGALLSREAQGDAFRRVARALLLEGLQDDELAVRLEAARGLAFYGEPADIGVLTPLLLDETVALRVEAAGAILQIGIR